MPAQGVVPCCCCARAPPFAQQQQGTVSNGLKGCEVLVEGWLLGTALPQGSAHGVTCSLDGMNSRGSGRPCF